MNAPFFRTESQGGYVLLEALVAMLVFAIGVLGVVSLQAVSAKNAGAAKLRTDASTLANQLIGRMWASDRTAKTLKDQFQGGPQGSGVTDGAGYTQWLGDVTKPGTVLGSLPGITVSSPDIRPTVIVTCLPNADCTPPPLPQASTAQVTIVLRWKIPGEEIKANGDPACQIPGQTEVDWHCFVAVAQMNAVNN